MKVEEIVVGGVYEGGRFNAAMGVSAIAGRRLLAGDISRDQQDFSEFTVENFAAWAIRRVDNAA